MARRVGPGDPGVGVWTEFRAAVRRIEGNSPSGKAATAARREQQVAAAKQRAAAAYAAQQAHKASRPAPVAPTPAPPPPPQRPAPAVQRLPRPEVEPLPALPWRPVLLAAVILIAAWVVGSWASGAVSPEARLLGTLTGLAAWVSGVYLAGAVLRRIFRTQKVRSLLVSRPRTPSAPVEVIDLVPAEPPPVPELTVIEPEPEPLDLPPAEPEIALPMPEVTGPEIADAVSATVEEAVDAVRRGGFGGLRDAFPRLPIDVVVRGVGAAAEERVGRMLEADLDVAWQVAHDLQVHSPRKGREINANIDHLISGPTGLYMIDTKSWSGTLGLRDGVLANLDEESERNDSRSRAPTTLLYEAGAIAVPPRYVIIAVEGRVRAPGGLLQIPYPANDENLPDIPIVAVPTDGLIDLVTAMTQRSGPDIETVVKRSKRLSWPRG